MGSVYYFFGTDNGDVHLLTFHAPIKSLFETPFKNQILVGRYYLL